MGGNKNYNGDRSNNKRNDNCHPSDYPNYPNQMRLKQDIDQKTILDQNFSNQTYYTMMSSLESIANYYQNKINQAQIQIYENKMFKQYDRVNYSQKSIQQLKCQLQTHIFLFQTSRKVFQMENPKAVWQLPADFDQNMSFNFISNAKGLFKTFDEESYLMAEDIQSILNREFVGLHSQKLDLKVNYTHQEIQMHNKNLASNAIKATEMMNQEQRQASKYQDVKDLKAKLNQQNKNTLFYQGNVNREVKQQPEKTGWSIGSLFN